MIIRVIENMKTGLTQHVSPIYSSKNLSGAQQSLALKISLVLNNL